LVTGGAGFIGSHVVDALLGLGHHVRVIDTLHAAAHATKPRYLDDRAEYQWADLRDPVAAARAVAGVDAVAHQAAMVGLGLDFSDVTAYVANNVMATAMLLHALHEAGFRGRIVLASSMVVYGEGRYHCANHGVVEVRRDRSLADLDNGRFDHACPVCEAPLLPQPIAEDAPTNPRNVYAATKLHQEHLCSIFARSHPGTTCTALRYHNVYGPRLPRNTPYAGVASIFRSALERGEAPRVFEDGRQLRDFVHVDDVARANVLALTTAEPFDGAVNVATGTPRSVLDMAKALADAFGPGAPRPVVVGGGRVGDVRHVFASPARARTRLGLEPTVDFADGMRAFARTSLR
jgi:dTDP-L-rhamnose 4-epimerase